MGTSGRNEIAAEVLARFDSGSGNQEVEIHMATIEEFIEIHGIKMKQVPHKHRVALARCPPVGQFMIRDLEDPPSHQAGG